MNIEPTSKDLTHTFQLFVAFPEPNTLPSDHPTLTTHPFVCTLGKRGKIYKIEYLNGETSKW